MMSTGSGHGAEGRHSKGGNGMSKGLETGECGMCLRNCT